LRPLRRRHRARPSDRLPLPGRGLMDTSLLVEAFEIEGRLLDATLRGHPRLRPLFAQEPDRIDRATLKDAYLRLLKLKADYVQFTVPALRAAGEALRDGDAGDREWSRLFLGYAA